MFLVKINSWSYLVFAKEILVVEQLTLALFFEVCYYKSRQRRQMNQKGVIKLFEGLPKFLRVSREGLALLECQFLRVWFEGLV